MVMMVRKYMQRLIYPIIGEIWMLHRVTNQITVDASLRSYDITPAFLELKIKDFLDKDFEFVSLDELARRVDKWNYEKRFVCITLDDGYKDNYMEALPIFRKYNIPFCIYVVPGYVVGSVKCKRGDGAPIMTIDDVVQISKEPLCTIGAHSYTHCRLGNCDVNRQREEIVSSIQTLESWINKPIRHFSPPYGSYNSQTLDILKAIGIETSVMAWGGELKRKTNLYNLPRILISENQ